VNTNILMKRDTHGAYQLILNELKIEDRQGFCAHVSIWFWKFT